MRGTGREPAIPGRSGLKASYLSDAARRVALWKSHGSSRRLGETRSRASHPDGVNRPSRLGCPRNQPSRSFRRHSQGFLSVANSRVGANQTKEPESRRYVVARLIRQTSAPRSSRGWRRCSSCDCRGKLDASPDPTMIARGEYLAHAGSCVSCHTGPDGKLFAGGHAMNTPFADDIQNKVITPDRENGIGGWSAEQFYRRGSQRSGPHGRSLRSRHAVRLFFQGSRGRIATRSSTYLCSRSRRRTPNRPDDLRWAL